ncbi:hypothetical protein [Nonomuraea dietziae]|uniref:hypothetical protein n=1 Tax=Nonomuraea dietziae TaxID=65515 RepID=UPI0031E20FB0
MTAVDPILVEIVEGTLASVEKRSRPRSPAPPASPMIRDATTSARASTTSGCAS